MSELFDFEKPVDPHHHNRYYKEKHNKFIKDYMKEHNISRDDITGYIFNTESETPLIFKYKEGRGPTEFPEEVQEESRKRQEEYERRQELSEEEQWELFRQRADESIKSLDEEIEKDLKRKRKKGGKINRYARGGKPYANGPRSAKA